jgi:phosphoglucosamine mutase
VEKIIEQRDFAFADWRQVGLVTILNSGPKYVDMLQKAAPLQKRWRIVVDPGCGATYLAAPAALTALGCSVTTLNAQPDGYFPARKSEPTVESLHDLAMTVKALGADLGVAFDGDGDRVAFVDETGEFVDFDRALAAYAAYFLKKVGGGVVVTNVEASMCVETMAEKQGGKVLRSRVGDVYVSEAIAGSGAVFGGEPCGAWVHPQFHWCPDGPLSAVLVLKALEEQGKGLRQLVAQVPQYVTIREKVSVKNQEKQRIISAVEKTIARLFQECKDISTVDGVRLALKNGWILIRASGTEPLIRLTVEGESLKAARDIMEKGVSLVKQNVGGT